MFLKMSGPLALLIVFSFSAEGVTIVNGSFESGVGPGTSKPSGSMDITGWTVLPDGVDWINGIGTVPEVLATDGSLYIDLNGNSTNPGGIQQSIVTEPGMRYEVTFDMNGNTNIGAPKSLEISAGGSQAIFTFTPTGATDPTWVPKAFSFTASSTITDLTFMSLVTGSSGGPIIDNVRIRELPTYTFTGFFAPVTNLPALNAVRAGATIPVKWQLQDATGNYVSNLAAVTSLFSAAMACDASPIVEVADALDSAGDTLLRYDSSANQFIFNWKTDRTWTGCRLLQLALDDGTVRFAQFSFR